MEVRISDLMDNIQDDTVKLDVQDIVSCDKIKEATMKKISVSSHNDRAVKRFRFKAISGIAAALVLLVVFSGIAIAVNAFGVADYFRNYFGGLNDEQAEVLKNISAINPVPEVSDDDTAINDDTTSSRIAVLAPVTSNGTTMTPLAAIADEQILYLALEIKAPEGVVLNPNTQGTEPGADGGYYQFMNPDISKRFEIVFDESAYKIAGYETLWTWQDEQPGDNVINCVIRVTAQINGIRWNDGLPKIIRIPGLWSQSPNKKYTQILDGLWEFEIAAFGVIEPVNLNVAGLVTYPYIEKEAGIIYRVDIEEGLQEREELKMTLDYITVSPLGIKYTYTCVYNEKMTAGPGRFRVIMNDGSKIDLSDFGGMATPDTLAGTMLVDGLMGFDEPVVLENVDYIQFGGLTIPMK